MKAHVKAIAFGDVPDPDIAAAKAEWIENTKKEVAASASKMYDKYPEKDEMVKSYVESAVKSGLEMKDDEAYVQKFKKAKKKLANNILAASNAGVPLQAILNLEKVYEESDQLASDTIEKGAYKDKMQNAIGVAWADYKAGVESTDLDAQEWQKKISAGITEPVEALTHAAHYEAAKEKWDKLPQDVKDADIANSDVSAATWYPVSKELQELNYHAAMANKDFPQGQKTKLKEDWEAYEAGKFGDLSGKEYQDWPADAGGYTFKQVVSNGNAIHNLTGGNSKSMDYLFEHDMPAYLALKKKMNLP